MTEIVRTWARVAREGDFYIEGQRPDNGDWEVVRLLRDETEYILTPTVDGSGSARIHVHRNDADDE